jgi:hypothetical protein
MACKNEQWLKELGKGVKIAKPRFGVVVHCTPTNEVRTPGGQRGEHCHRLHESCGKGGEQKAPSFPHSTKTSRCSMLVT